MGIGISSGASGLMVERLVVWLEAPHTIES